MDIKFLFLFYAQKSVKCCVWYTISIGENEMNNTERKKCKWREENPMYVISEYVPTKAAVEVFNWKPFCYIV